MWIKNLTFLNLKSKNWKTEKQYLGMKDRTSFLNVNMNF